VFAVIVMGCDACSGMAVLFFVKTRLLGLCYCSFV
jgi:hypothetical protein